MCIRDRWYQRRVRGLFKKKMRYKQLGSSGLQVSEFSLGTMTFGNQNTEQEAHQQLDFALSVGINFIDTAESYPTPFDRETQGRTEQYIGTWIEKNKDKRDKFILATKVTGYSTTDTWIPANRTSPRGEEKECRLDAKSIRAAAEASLRRLKTDYIDLFYLHWPDRYKPGFGFSQYKRNEERESVSFDEQVLAISQLIKEGKVRHWAVSNESTFGVCQMVESCRRLGVPPPVAIQNSYSLVHRSFEGELAEACSPLNYNIGLVNYSPLAGGMLTGKYLSNNADSKSRFNQFPSYQKRFQQKRVYEAVEKYDELAKKKGISVAHMSLSFCRSREFISSTIIGGTSLQQLQENLKSSDVTLDDQTVKEIDDIYLQFRDPQTMD
eukprot:TRINITY_DN3343_c0_g2_i1.p1 TRINITY_DN3343_c0_g2~~TRINITY_DN3343_c0_g2_i1.p1  ORF type:complete len:381 (+),score=116.65 TRINITY_DN3343_c0_g2_i1:1-1143(+)